MKKPQTGSERLAQAYQMIPRSAAQAADRGCFPKHLPFGAFYAILWLDILNFRSIPHALCYLYTSLSQRRSTAPLCFCAQQTGPFWISPGSLAMTTAANLPRLSAMSSASAPPPIARAPTATAAPRSLSRRSRVNLEPYPHNLERIRLCFFGIPTQAKM